MSERERRPAVPPGPRPAGASAQHDGPAPSREQAAGGKPRPPLAAPGNGALAAAARDGLLPPVRPVWERYSGIVGTQALRVVAPPGEGSGVTLVMPEERIVARSPEVLKKDKDAGKAGKGVEGARQDDADEKDAAKKDAEKKAAAKHDAGEQDAEKDDKDAEKDDKDEKDEKDEKDGKGAAGGEGAAPVGGKQKRRGGGDEDEASADGGGGDGGGAGAGPEGAGGGGDGGPALEPAPPPRFEGTQAVRVPPAPSFPAARIEQIRASTGLTPSEHHARTQNRLDGLAIRADAQQHAIVTRIVLNVEQTRQTLLDAASRIPEHIGTAMGGVRGAFAGARGAINSAARWALKEINDHSTEATRTMKDASLTSKEALDAVITASSPRLQAIYQETVGPLKKALKTTADKITSTGADQGTAMIAKGTEITNAFEKAASTPLLRAQAEKKTKLVGELTQQAATDFTQAGKEGGKQILAQETTMGLSFLALVNPAAVQVEEAAGKDKSTVAGKEKQVTLRLSNDYERAKDFIETSQKTALAQLAAGERSAIDQLTRLEGQLKLMAESRIERLCNAMEHGEAPAAEGWAQQMARVNGLVPSEGMVDFVKLEPRFLESEQGFAALWATQCSDFDRQAQGGLDEARTGLAEDLRGVDQAAEAAIGSAHTTGEQAATIRAIATRFASGFRGVAHPASSAADRFTIQAEEKLGQPVAAVRKHMKDLLGKTTTALGEQEVEFKARLVKQITDLPTHLASTLDKSDLDVITDIGSRAERAYAAMDRIGTQEGPLFRALSNMTPRLGAALEAYWEPRHTNSLAWWLDDELSGDEYWAAVNYLAGDPVAGAKYELASTIHWYGDDKAQVEQALRALTPEDAKKLNNEPGFASVRSDLEGSLKGTDLQVMQALLAGRVARADAFRLREKIDAARSQDSDDKLHDVLSAVDPKQLPEIRREFAHLEKGGGLKDPIKVTDQEAIEALKTHVTREVEVYVPDYGEGPGTYYKAKLSKDSEALAVALVTTGEGSPEARAARLSFEVGRGGKPRLDKLDKAASDPELARARVSPILTDPKADPKAVELARANLAELEAKRTRMLAEFARLRGADEATRKDPEKAREFAKTAVSGLYDDKLKAELGASLVTDARANPAIAIKLAVRGDGTNEELIRRTLRGMTPAEIKALKLDYSARFAPDNPNALYDDLGVFQNAATARAAGVTHATKGGFFTELSGDDRQEVEELLLGTPENDRDRMRLARLKREHQLGEGSTWVSRGLFSDSDPGKALRMDSAAMEAMVERAGGEEHAFDKDGNFIDTPENRRNDFRLHTEGVREGAASYKHHIDSIAESITGAIAIIGAIVGTIVVVVLSAGTATPLVIGLWAAGIAAATGAAAMATNYALKGSRYGWEEAGVDAALTLLDAATAGLTAGAGAAAGKAVKAAQMAKALAKAPSERALAGALLKQQMQRELVRGFGRSAAGAGISGAARTATTDGTWDDGILRGLGRVAGGGVKSAFIGTVTHGAGTAFSRSGVGQRLAQSESMIGRGLGSGVGGALGSMAGRSAEIGVDVATGHHQGPWHEALGSIVAAGGRGFVENFGHGATEAALARRSGAHAGRTPAEDLPISRARAAEQAEAGHAAFRRQALLTALIENPRLDRKVFLARLDAAVANDHAVADAQRRTIRELRREALAGIPPAQRKQFAEVPIRLLSDQEFEHFTGSKSGRAVTIFIDGEAQIVARRNISPGALREEGIHVLQSKDPRFKARIARLDERNLASWHDMDLETQLSLYKDKLEVEIDGQRRLRRSLVDEAEQTPDARKRAALLARAEEANETLAALRGRRREVDGLGPEHLDAMRGGKLARPQYLDEPPRLFSKKGRDLSVPELNPDEAMAGKTRAIEHGSPDLPDLPRKPVARENTTFEQEYDATHKFKQVGEAWSEPEHGKSRNGRAGPPHRWYRMVEVYDAAGTLVDRRREILQLGANRRWQQRGSESSTWGSVFEAAVRLRTIANLEAQLQRTIRPNEDAVVPIGALRTLGDKSGTPLSAQHGGGAGFDDVVIHFSKGPGGEDVAHIVIVEAKGYRRSMTLGDFSAITTNLDKNLGELRKAIMRSDLSDDRIKAVTRAIAERRLGFEVHASPTTGLGDIASGRASILRDVVNTELARRQLALARERLARVVPDNEEHQKLIRADAAKVEALGKRLTEAYAAEPFRPDRVHAALNAILRGTRTFEPARKIAGRHDLELDGTRPGMQRVVVDVDGADQGHVENARRARAVHEAGRAAVNLARNAGLAEEKLVPVATDPAKKEVSVWRSPDGRRSIAVMNPMIREGTGAELAAAREILELLQNGVGGKNGAVRPDHVIWDATRLTPAKAGRVVVGVVEGLFVNLAQNLGDPARLRLVLPGTVAADEAGLRKAVRLPSGARVEQRTGPHDQTYWVVSFEPTSARPK